MMVFCFPVYIMLSINVYFAKLPNAEFKMNFAKFAGSVDEWLSAGEVVICEVFECSAAKTIVMASSRFADVQQAPPIEVFAVSKAFTDSAHEKKVNLSVGGK